MLFEKFPELGFRDAVVRCLERLPNFFAAGKGSGIIAPGLMTEKIGLSSFLPCFRGFACLRLTVEYHREKKANFFRFPIYLRNGPVAHVGSRGLIIPWSRFESGAHFTFDFDRRVAMSILKRTDVLR